MKKLIALLLLVTPFVASCGFHASRVVGSGQRVRQKRDIPAFTSIRSEGAYQIEVVSQQALSLEVEGDDNLMPIIRTEVNSGILRITTTTGFSSDKPIIVKIGTPDIEGIYASGAGTFEVSELKNEKFEIDSNGAPTIRVSGETGTVVIDANGAGKIDTHKLRATKGTVQANGVPKVEVNASEELNVTVSGPASVVYSGDPKLNKKVNGPGSVERRASEGA